MSTLPLPPTLPSLPNASPFEIASPPPSTTPQQAQCLLDAGFESQTFLPTDEKYIEREGSYWSVTARLQPACIVLPRSAAEVAGIVKALVAANQKFAVRSGGHTSWPGSNNIKDGVTIDLSLLNTVTYDPNTTHTKIGPGATWLDVYTHLHTHGRAVTGGRAGDVGVGGLLLGGGKSFSSGRNGFACDNVISYDLILASGALITVTSSSHADLFRALKGGGNNFGIVTSYTMTTFPCGSVWGGMLFLSGEHTDAALTAMAKFTDNVEQDPDSHAIVLASHVPGTGKTGVVVYCAQMEGVEAPPAYDDFLALPQTGNTLKMTTSVNMVEEFTVPAGYYHIWHTQTFTNDPRITQHASHLHHVLISKLQTLLPSNDFITQCIIQSVPTLYASPTRKNSLGITRHKQNGIQLLAAAMLKHESHVPLVAPLLEEWGHAVRDFARARGALLPWVDLNYAGASQNPLASYGRENVERLRRVAKEYDPCGVFQTLCPGGFKISRVRDEDIVS